MNKSVVYHFENRVRYVEVDQMQMVYHAKYFDYWEWGRTEMIRSLGMPYKKLEDSGYFLPTLDISASYKFPGKYDDVLNTKITMTWDKYKLYFSYETHCDKKLLVVGKSCHIFINKELRPVKIPEMMLHVITK